MNTKTSEQKTGSPRRRRFAGSVELVPAESPKSRRSPRAKTSTSAISCKELDILEAHGTSDVKALVAEIRRLRKGVMRIVRGNYLNTATMENALVELL